MPQPKKKVLRKDQGIREIEVAPPEGASPSRRMTLYIHDGEKKYLEDIAGQLTARLGRPVSKSQAIRWAIRNINWDKFELI